MKNIKFWLSLVTKYAINTRYMSSFDILRKYNQFSSSKLFVLAMVNL